MRINRTYPLQRITLFAQAIFLHLQMKNKKNNICQNLLQQNILEHGALTEPNTGSDAGNMKCTAEKEGDDWIINGTKNWITHGKSGDVAVVICRTGEPRYKR